MSQRPHTDHVRQARPKWFEALFCFPPDIAKWVLSLATPWLTAGDNYRPDTQCTTRARRCGTPSILPF